RRGSTGRRPGRTHHEYARVPFLPRRSAAAGVAAGASAVTATATATTTLPRRQPASVPPAPAESRPAGDPRWVKPCLFALLAGTAVLYLWGLGASGWANSFYSAAVQAGTKSWKAFFFGSSDASNFITIDKTPAFLWPMELSARVFGVNAWSILVPQAAEASAAVT